MSKLCTDCKQLEPRMYTFFKENARGKEFKLSSTEVKKRFLAWMKSKKTKWLELKKDFLINSFVQDVDGLNAVTNEAYDLYNLLLLTKGDYLHSVGIDC